MFYFSVLFLTQVVDYLFLWTQNLALSWKSLSYFLRSFKINASVFKCSLHRRHEKEEKQGFTNTVQSEKKKFEQCRNKGTYVAMYFLSSFAKVLILEGKYVSTQI